MNDWISDFLTRIRNLALAGRSVVTIPSSNILVSISRVLKEEGYIETYEVLPHKSYSLLYIYLKKIKRGNHAPFSVLKRVSKPALSFYCSVKKIPVICSGLGNVILTTSKGVMTGKSAKKLNVAGKILFIIY